MLTGRTLAGKRLPLAVAFTLLLVGAFGAGCQGFFTSNTLTAIALQPPSPQIQVGQSQTIEAWGTYSDNSRAKIKSGVAWTSLPETVISIDPTTGLAMANSGGTATITASAQGLSATGTGTAYYGTITGFQVCLGIFGATTSCSSGASALTWSVGSGNSASFIAQGTYVNMNGQSQLADLTTTSTWNAVIPTPVAGSISCSNSGISPETCTVGSGTTPSPPTYVFTVTYGSGNTATVNVTVTS